MSKLNKNELALLKEEAKEFISSIEEWHEQEEASAFECMYDWSQMKVVSEQNIKLAKDVIYLIELLEEKT